MFEGGGTLYDQNSFTYDSRNNLKSESDNTRFTYDEEGRLVSRTNPDNTTSTLTYDNYGNLSKITVSNGLVYSYTYDLEGHVKEAKAMSGATTLADYTYTYNEVGGLLTQNETNGTPTLVKDLIYSLKDALKSFNLVYNNGSAIPFSYEYS